MYPPLTFILSDASWEKTIKLRTLTKEVKKHRAQAGAPATPPMDTVARPRGENGKRGWNLQTEMGLENDKATYNKILVRHLFVMHDSISLLMHSISVKFAVSWITPRSTTPFISRGKILHVLARLLARCVKCIPISLPTCADNASCLGKGAYALPQAVHWRLGDVRDHQASAR